MIVESNRYSKHTWAIGILRSVQYSGKRIVKFLPTGQQIVGRNLILAKGPNYVSLLQIV